MEDVLQQWRNWRSVNLPKLKSLAESRPRDMRLRQRTIDLQEAKDDDIERLAVIIKREYQT